MSAAPLQPPLPYALARSCAEPLSAFATPEELAALVVERCGGRPRQVASKCLTTARDPRGEAAFTVYALNADGDREGFVGYAFGFSDPESLHQHIASARRLAEEATHGRD